MLKNRSLACAGPVLCRAAKRQRGARCWRSFEEQPVWPKRALADVAGVSPAVIAGLIEADVLEAIDLAAPRPYRDPDPEFGTVDLASAQREAADKISEAIGAGAFSALLLDGVTGSGKTEVYFEGLAEAFRKGRQGLVLMPEIALTQDFLDRFERRFGTRPGEWHSGIAGRIARQGLARCGVGRGACGGWCTIGPVSTLL
jgi:primosomal protein N' (replication factor Y)